MDSFIEALKCQLEAIQPSLCELRCTDLVLLLLTTDQSCIEADQGLELWQLISSIPTSTKHTASWLDLCSKFVLGLEF